MVFKVGRESNRLRLAGLNTMPMVERPPGLYYHDYMYGTYYDTVDTMQITLSAIITLNGIRNK